MKKIRQDEWRNFVIQMFTYYFITFGTLVPIRARKLTTLNTRPLPVQSAGLLKSSIEALVTQELVWSLNP